MDDLKSRTGTIGLQGLLMKIPNCTFSYKVIRRRNWFVEFPYNNRDTWILGSQSVDLLVPESRTTSIELGTENCISTSGFIIYHFLSRRRSDRNTKEHSQYKEDQ